MDVSGNFNKKCSFYRTSSKLFAQKSSLIEVLPLNNEEKKNFRPDLTFRVCRTKEFCWNGFEKLTFDEFKLQASRILPESVFTQKLLAEKIVLIPYGNHGGHKKGSVITADNCEYFECVELIWKARQLQEAVNKQISIGVGLYRSGFEKRLPSFYIGEYFDFAGLWEMEES
jgi:hypothetical protein